MKKHLLLLILLIMPFAKAETLFYEAWVINNKNLILNGETYKIVIGEQGKKLVMMSSSQSYTLNLGECTSQEYLKYCFNMSVKDSYTNEYKGYIKIYYLEPNLKIKREMQNPIILLGESSWFKVDISNIGESLAANITYIDEFPDGIIIEDVRNANAIGNKIVWTGELEAGESEEIQYLVRAISPVNKEIKAKARYFNGFNYKDVYSDSVSIYSSPIINVNFKTPKDNFEILEDIPITIKFSNAGTEEADISFNIVLPESINVKNKENKIKQINKNLYQWKGTIKPEKTKNLSLTLLSNEGGIILIYGEGNYTYNKKQFSLGGYNKGIFVENIEPEITTSLNPVNYINSKEIIPLYVKIKNKNSFTRLKEVKIKTITEIAAIEESKISYVEKNQTIQILNTEIMAPEVYAEKTYPIYFNVTYSSETGSNYSSLLERKIVLRPFKGIAIEQKFSSQAIFENEECIITVHVSNLGENEFKSIYLKADIPKHLIIKGATSAYIDLAKNEKKDAFSFSVRSERVDRERDFPINITAVYVNDGKEYYANSFSLLKIMPVSPKLSAKKTLSSDNAYMGEIISVSYEVINEDNVPVFDIILKPSETKELDYIGNNSFYIEKLNPGEKIVIEGEQIKSKKEGMIDTGSAFLIYKDEHKRDFNTTSGSRIYKVEKAIPETPAIYITQESDKDIYLPGENITITINISNLGLQRADGIFEEQKVSLPYSESKIIKKVISFNEQGIYILPKYVFNFSVYQKKARAYSNELTIYVKNEAEIQQNLKENRINTQEKQTTTNANQKDTNKKQNVLTKIFNWLKKIILGKT